MALAALAELWSNYRALGGVREAFLCCPVVLEDTVDLTDGTDGLRAAWPKLHPHADKLVRGKVLHVVFTDGSRLEKEIDDWRVSAGPDPLRVVRCVGIGERLRHLRIEQIDADGFVSEEVPIAQLAPTVVLQTILAGAPTAFVVGTVTPTDLVEIQFSRDSKLSGIMKLAAECGVEHQFRLTATQVHVDLIVLGATAPALRLRTGQNLEDLDVEVQGAQVTLARAVGGQSDDGGPASLAWAFWEVGTPSGNVVPLASIHAAGGGPIKFTGQGTDFRVTNLLANPDPSASVFIGTPVVTRDAFVGGGYSMHLIADNDGAAIEHPYWAITIPNTGAAATGVVVLGFILKKGSTHAGTDYAQLWDQTAGVARLSLDITWDGAGVPTVTASAGVFTDATHVADGVYFIRGQAAGVVPANSHRVRVIPGGDLASRQTNIYYGDCVVANQVAAVDRPQPWYLQKKDGTVTRVNATNAVTQEVTVGFVTGLAAGDWVRFVANGAKQHLTELETPERVTYGDRPGDQTGEWDDAVNILVNGTGRIHTNASARPDGWTGSTGTASKTTAAGEWLTAGQATKLVVASLSGPAAAIAGRSRAWYIHKRRTVFSATAWLRILALSLGQVGLRITRGGVLVGEIMTYRSPINGWIQLKIEGLSFEGDVGTTQTLGVDVMAVPDAGSNMSATVIVDSLMLGPSFQARGMLEGAGPARLWQDTNDWVDEARVEPRRHRISALDLERAGYPRTAAVALGGTVLTTESRHGLATNLSERIVRRTRDLLRATATEIGTTTAPSRLKAKLSGYTPLTVPFFEPIEVKAPVRDTRQAAQILRAVITSQTASQITITLTHSDLLNGSPVISYAPSAAVSYVSGSGLGPYVFSKPAAGAGVGRVVFTAQLTGRSDAVDAVDVPENSSPIVEMKAVQLSKTSEQIVVRVSTATVVAGATVTVAYDAGGLTISPASGGTTSSMGSITGSPSGAQYIEYTITRPNWGTGAARVQFTGAATGYQAGTVSVDVPAKERPNLLCRASLQTINATTVVVRVAVADPFPPGGATVTVTYAANPAGGVTPASGGTLTPTNDIGTTGTIDYTIDRPGANSPAKRVTFTAADATNNRVASSDAIDVPPQDPPSLQLQSNEHSSTQWKITWSATGTVEVSKNNGAYGTPAAAGLTSGTAFNRPAYGAADDVYSFRATAGGVTISNEVIVPATKDLTGHSLSVSTPFGVDTTPGPQKIDISWSDSGMPSGTTFDVEYQVYTSGNSPTGAAGFHTNVTSTLTVNPSPAFVETDKVRITVYAKHQGKIIATATRYATATF